MKIINPFLLVLFILFAQISSAQPKATTAESVGIALSQKKEMQNTSLVKNIPFANIGPSIMSGRVTDLAVNPENPTEFYVAYASGGVWYTTNNGTSFLPILDNSDTQNVGDIAVDWKAKTIWVGTGENNSSRSSYAGIGVLKSDDNGATWENIGLNDSHHIGRILINPNDNNEIIVGVTGHLYSPNTERGVYKTTDGGKTWIQSLFIDDLSGIIDLQHSPNDFNVMFASSWTKDRKAWHFNGSGNNSAIYKSTDAGTTWNKVSTNQSGFPIGTGVGRIGLALFSNNIIYAIHDNQFRRKKNDKEKDDGLTKEDFKTMTNQTFLKLNSKDIEAFLKDNDFPEEYSAETVIKMIKSGEAKPTDLSKYLDDANSQLFDTPVIGTEVYKSTDGGQSWKKTHDDFLDDIYYSYGYYFGHIYVSPKNENHIYIYGVPILKSKDGGKTFESINAENVHVDHHALWINPTNPKHLINGNDGGVNISYDDGEHWIKNNSPSVGQFYAINVDNQKPYNIYGGLQDNGVWGAPHTSIEDNSWHQEGQYPWKRLLGGDGMYIEIDNRNANIVYTGYQFGNYFRINKSNGKRKYIKPKHKLGENPYRFNWQTPILLSPHNQDILYLGSNKLMRSFNKGDTWEAISDDLSTGGKKGNVAYGTIATISESPLKFGLIYTGSDDGYIYVTKNAGSSWKRISDNLPQQLWVSRIIASKHKKERVYVTLNGYRWDNFEAYVYSSEDFGNTWKSISSNIPNSAVNVIREDPKNENILYIGTDNGAYISFNKGDSWEAFSQGLPNVAIHDMVVQAETKHLLLGTHGRSIYKADISALQQINSSIQKNDITLFDIEEIKHSKSWGSSWNKWIESREPSVNISFYSKDKKPVIIKIISDKETELNTFKIEADKGFNSMTYNLSIPEKSANKLVDEDNELDIVKGKNGAYYLPKGTYFIKMGSKKTTLEIK